MAGLGAGETLRIVRAALALAVVLLLSACGSGAQQQVTTTQTYTANGLLLDGFIGTVAIETGTTPGVIGLSVTATQSQRELLPIAVSRGTLTIAWQGEPDRRRSWYEIWRGRFLVDMEDIGRYPRLTITIPPEMAIEIRELIAVFTIADRTGPLEIGINTGSGTIGSTATAKVTVNGEAALTIGRVSDRLQLVIAGTGDVQAAGAMRADVSLSGSGDVTVGPVRSLTVRLSGAGAVDAVAAGTADVEVSGSGQVRLGTVEGSFIARGTGSGNISAASVTGSFRGTVAGSGGITVRGGRATFDAAVAGSGDVRFGGTAINPSVSLEASGNVLLGAVEGELTTLASGSGIVRIGE